MDYCKIPNKKDMEEFQKHYAMRPDFSYGFPSLDRLTKGLHSGELIVWGGRPGEGKTSLSVQIAGNIARAGHKVAYFSNEMPRQAIWAKICSAQTGVPVEKIMDGSVDEYAIDRVNTAFENMATWPFHVYDMQEGTDSVLVKSILDSFKPELIVIDHLQMAVSIDPYEHEIDILKRAMGEYKKLATQSGCCIMLLSQLNRDIEGRKSIIPKLRDLMGSSKIEAIADRVILCCYPNKVLQDTEKPDTKYKETDYFLCLAKNRYGAVGKIKINFYAETSLFVEDA